MNPKTVGISVAALILVVIMFYLLNPGKLEEEIKIQIIETSIQETETTEVNQSIIGGFGGFFGGLFGGGSGGGGSGGGGGGGGGGGPSSTVIGGTSTTSVVVGGNTTTSTSTSTSTTSTSSTTSTTSTIFGTTTSTTSSTTSTIGSSTTVGGCASNFVIDYNLDCKGTTGSTDDDLYASITNNNPSGYALDVYVDNNLEISGYLVGAGGLGLIYSNTMTSWWRSQVSSSSRVFNIRIEYSGSCSMTRQVTVDFPSGNSGCVD